MDVYNIIFKPSVEKDLRKIPDAMVTRIIERVMVKLLMMAYFSCHRFIAHTS